MSMSRMEKIALSGGLAALVLAAAMLSMNPGAIRSAPIDEASLVGIWVDGSSGSVLDFDATGRVELTNFVYLSTRTRERSPGQNAVGDWYVNGEARSVRIGLDEPIEGVSAIGFDSMTCGSVSCLRYGPEDGDALLFRREK